MGNTVKVSKFSECCLKYFTIMFNVKDIEIKNIDHLDLLSVLL